MKHSADVCLRKFQVWQGKVDTLEAVKRGIENDIQRARDQQSKWRERCLMRFGDIPS